MGILAGIAATEVEPSVTQCDGPVLPLWLSQENPDPGWSSAVCEKCEKLDERIGHYRHLLSLIVDQQALDGIKLLIEKHEADKKALHPSR